ncbi:MAG: type I restriction enzyme HsdR N-terminal domain-containing protein, partial [Desulfobacula sp.]|nr:type I restriction enzyme HsdR N-terminal domain-containing protein [Desulfobacula sp.]
MNLNDNKTVTDYITGQLVKNIGPEASRQIFERFLVQDRGWQKTDIKVDKKIIVQFKGKDYLSKIDLIVYCKDKAFMAVTCVAGSIGSYEREILAGARLIYDYQIPFSVSTDARDAVIMDTLTGKKYGEGIDSVFSKE